MNYNATKTPRHEVLIKIRLKQMFADLLIKTNPKEQMVSMINVLSDFAPSW